MRLTYVVDQSIVLQSGDGYFDLHNDYELVSALHEGTRSYLHFVKRTAAWVKTHDSSHLTLIFEQVDHFHISVGTQMPTSIEEIGCKEPMDFDMDWLMEQPEEESTHMLFRLEGDQFI